MYLERISLNGFGLLPDGQINLDSGLNILVDKSRVWHSLLPMFLSGMLFGLSDDARERLLPREGMAFGELVFFDRGQRYRLRVELDGDTEIVKVEASQARAIDGRTAASGTAQRMRTYSAYVQAATAGDIPSVDESAGSALSVASWHINDLRIGMDRAFRRLLGERQRITNALDAISLELLERRANRARQLMSELCRLEKQLRGDSAGHSLGDNVAVARSLESHIASLTKVIAAKEVRLKEMKEQLEAGRRKLSFYEYLDGIGFNEITAVKRSLERKRWLLEDLQQLETEIEQGSKRLDAISSLIKKYDRLTPFLGPRETELDRLEERLKQLAQRLPDEKLRQIEMERRVVRLQIRYWRKRRLMSAVLLLLPLPVALLWPPAAVLSIIGAVFVWRYWREISFLVERMANLDDRYDYLTLEKNLIEIEMGDVQQQIDTICEQAGVACAEELHNKIEEYQKLLSELEDLKRKAAQREKARDEVLIKLREEEQRAGVLFDRVGLSSGLDAETVERFVNMVTERIDEERALKDLARKIEDEQSEIDKLSRQVGTLRDRLDKILAFYGVESVAALQQLWNSSDEQETKRLYERTTAELQQLLNGQRLSDLEARIELLRQLVPEAERVVEIASEATVDRLETRLESIRVRLDVLKWLKESTMPMIAESAFEGELDDAEKRQACVELCLMSRGRQLLTLVPNESWEAEIRSVAGDLGIPVRTVMLADHSTNREITEV